MTPVRPASAHPDAASYWMDTAIPAQAAPALTESRSTDVLIVGAGFTGLSTALHLAPSGASTMVIDAHQPGWGASGRNGGQVNPTLKYDPDELIAMFGDRAGRLIHTIATSADQVFDLINHHRIDCNPVRSGWLQVSYKKSGIPALHRRARQWQDRGYFADSLDSMATQRLTGTRAFHGGWIDRRAGSLHPLSYVRGLHQAALAAGAQVFGDSPVTRLSRQGDKWLARLANGARITADQVVLATNGYSDALLPGLSQTILSANSFIIATSALGDKTRHILPSGETLSTAERLLIYLRKEADGRLLLGGRGLFDDPAGAGDFAHIERSMTRIYPDLAPFHYEYRWAGRIAITRDFLPHVHRPAPGMLVALGYNGRGVAAATVMGIHLARLLVNGDETEFPFPITPLRKIPLHGALQHFYISAGVAWYGLLDRLAR
ncbi:NAD(P)/FAD-dependent oxidoreductase [Castellaniella sp.]|uniref:NAD(P)/FAD-dependent oxidoreductase n=1 Tax=Castellaniella sp. TaxID=1955812 RepID=UPI003C7303C0